MGPGTANMIFFPVAGIGAKGHRSNQKKIASRMALYYIRAERIPWTGTLKSVTQRQVLMSKETFTYIERKGVTVAGA